MLSIERRLTSHPDSTLGTADHSIGMGICRFVDPAILRTCRFVHEEARTVLYGKNEFRFTVRGHSYSSHNRAKLESVFREQCDDIFKYNERDWLRSDGPFLLSNAPLARFLNKIGARNAASLRVVELLVDCRYVCTSREATDLLVRHMPALKTVRVLLQGWISYEKDVILDRLHKQDVVTQRFCRTLREMGRGRFSLEVFKNKGDHFRPVQDLEARPEYLGNVAPLSTEGKEMNGSDTDTN